MTRFIGLDLGQLQDYTARAVVRVDDPPKTAAPVGALFHPASGGTPHHLPVSGSTWDDARAPVAVAPPPPKAPDAPPHLHVRGLHRWELKTKYGAIVADMKAFLAGLPENERWHLIIDGTGVGVAVLEQFDQAGIPYEAVSIHGGMTTTRDGKLWRVPKKALVSAVQVPLQNRTMTIPPQPYAKELRAELGNFRHTITSAANDTYAAWREADHDDLVLALAIAAWRATRAHRRVWAV